MSAGIIASSFFKPLYLNPVAWWSPKNINGDGTNPPNSTAAASWSDLTHNALNYTQATSALRPTYLTAGFNSAFPCMDFNSASTQYMSVAANSLLDLTGAKTIVIVFSASSSASAKNILAHYGTSNPFAGWGVGFGDSGTNAHLCDYWSSLNGTWKTLSNTTIDDGTVRVLTIILAAGTVTGYLNGVLQLATASSSNPTSSVPLYLGATPSLSAFLTGKIGDVVLCNFAASTSQRQLLERYCGREAGITI